MGVLRGSFAKSAWQERSFCPKAFALPSVKIKVGLFGTNQEPYMSLWAIVVSDRRRHMLMRSEMWSGVALANSYVETVEKVLELA